MEVMKDESKFDNNGIHSATWAKLKDHIEKRIISLQGENNSPSLSEVKTAVIRGRIAELQKLLSTVEPTTIKTKRDKPSTTVEDRLAFQRRQ
jgi:hypothetical protein